MPAGRVHSPISPSEPQARPGRVTETEARQRAGEILAARCPQMTDFPREAPRAALELSAEKQAGTEAGTQIDEQEIVHVLHRADVMFGEGRPVHVVIDLDFG